MKQHHAICPLPECKAAVFVTYCKYQDGIITRYRKCRNGHTFKTVEAFPSAQEVRDNK